jgi:hypothetical protein
VDHSHLWVGSRPLPAGVKGHFQSLGPFHI